MSAKGGSLCCLILGILDLCIGEGIEERSCSFKETFAMRIELKELCSSSDTMKIIQKKKTILIL